MTLSYHQLYTDLLLAYNGAKRHKGSRSYVRAFEQHKEAHLHELCSLLLERNYLPQPSSCFLISDPKKREIFAAQFRDRIVHHLYYNYTHRLFERTFIADSYSCIAGRGTLYGVERLEQHIRQESLGFTRSCYVLQLDIRGYFIGINRMRLLELCRKTLSKMANRRVLKHANKTWNEVIDYDFVDYLTRVIVLLNPAADCHRRGWLADWETLPKNKSLFHARSGCGLPIGNLTSQLFSNVYLNELDQFAKRTLHCKHYGRYVDDFFVVSHDRQWCTHLYLNSVLS